MSDLPYLIRLGNRLSDGLSGLDEERRSRHRRAVVSYQMPDGGFRGRDGDSDLYYTSFAVRSLMMLGGMPEEESRTIAEFLHKHDWRNLNIIDLMNWLATALAIQVACGIDLLKDAPDDWRSLMTSQLEAVRTDDGGYAKSREGASGSTYHSFLVVLTYQLIGMPLPRPNALVQFLYDRQRDDGGFVEIGPMRRSGTNPTAAAAAMLNEFGAVDNEIRDDLRAFFRDVRSDEGGYQANGRVPFADSLSTFTALLTCQDLNLGEIASHVRIREWLEGQLEFPDGGFRAATWDESVDVEYTFYGLGLLSLLNQQ